MAAQHRFPTMLPTDLFLSGIPLTAFGRIAGAGVLFHLFSATVAFTVTLSRGSLSRDEGVRGQSSEKQDQYIFGGWGFPPFCSPSQSLPVSGVPVYPLGNFSFIPAIFLAFGVLNLIFWTSAPSSAGDGLLPPHRHSHSALYPGHLSLPGLLSSAPAAAISFVLSLVLALIIVLLFTPFGSGAEPHRHLFSGGATITGSCSGRSAGRWPPSSAFRRSGDSS